MRNLSDEEMMGRKNYKTALFVGAVFFMSIISAALQAAPVRSQDRPPEHLRGHLLRMLEQAGESGADTEALSEYLEALLLNPLNINTASAEQLESLPLMTPFMAASIVEYRTDYGAISSFAELSLVFGFDEQLVNELRPFISLDGSPAAGVRCKPLKQKLILRTKTSFTRVEEELYGIPLSLYSKYSITYKDRYSAGFTLETDRGERGFPDFYSIYLQVKDLPLGRQSGITLQSLTVGDYSLRFGQGLVLWNGFSMSGLSNPSAAFRKQHGVTPYTSSDENAYFHGIGTTLSVSDLNLEVSAAYSHNLLDARIEGGRFVTLPEDGLHDSGRLREARNTLGEDLFGFNLCWRNDFLKLGTTAALYRYALPDGRRTSYYNEHLRYDGWWGNCSLDFLFSYRGYRLFGEAAIDRRAAFAGILGAILPLWPDADGSILYRYYDPHYIATHSGAYSASSCNNEHGLTASLRWSPVRSLALNASAEYTHFPYHRYGVRGASDKLKASADCEWSLSDASQLYFKASFSWDNGRETRTGKLRAEYLHLFDFGLQSVTRAELCLSGTDEITPGGLLFSELVYTSSSEKLKSSARVTLFSATDWDARIYAYERDLPGSFSVPAYYGEGVSIYAMLTYKPYRWLNVSIKCSGTMYKDESRDRLRLNVQATLPF